MQTIVTHRIVHQNMPRLALEFAYDAALIEKVKQVKDARWSQSLRSWHIPLTSEAYEQLKELTLGLAQLQKGESRLPLEMKPPLGQPTPEIAATLNDFTRYLEQRRYSPRTIQTYEHEGFKNNTFSCSIDTLQKDIKVKLNQFFISPEITWFSSWCGFALVLWQLKSQN